MSRNVPGLATHIRSAGNTRSVRMLAGQRPAKRKRQKQKQKQKPQSSFKLIGETEECRMYEFQCPDPECPHSCKPVNTPWLKSSSGKFRCTSQCCKAKKRSNSYTIPACVMREHILESEKVTAEEVKAEKLKAANLKAEKLEAANLKAAMVKKAAAEAEKLEAEELKTEKLKAAMVKKAEKLEAAKLKAAKLNVTQQPEGGKRQAIPDMDHFFRC